MTEHGGEEYIMRNTFIEKVEYIMMWTLSCGGEKDFILLYVNICIVCLMLGFLHTL